MEIWLKQRVVIAVSAAAALYSGWQIANGQLLLAGLLAGACMLWLLHRLARVELSALAAGVLLAGYLIGNRGFAQLHIPGLPLLPGEAVLGLALVLGLWRAAWTRVLPIRTDALNFFVLGWIGLGAARVLFDMREHGMVAVRDFAMVYYALFFFLAQRWAQQPAEHLWLRRCLLLGLALCAPVFAAFDQWMSWFATHLTFAGVPIIFVKTDVAGGFMAAGALWFVCRHAATGGLGWLALTTIALGGVATCNSRAAAVATLVGVAWLAALRLWRPLRTLLILIVVGIVGLAVHAVAAPRPFSATPFYRLYESASSVLDVSGTRTYRTADLSDKPENNQFRLVWWQTIVDRTTADSLWLGQGFGSDLAADFLRIYYADSADDFTTRSPHNILLTIFGRMGLVGLLAFLCILAVAAWQTVLAGRRERTGTSADQPLPYWLGAWAIFTSACFGVVMEGPMGAIAFWTFLGLANTVTSAPVPATEEEDTTKRAPLLPADQPGHEVSVSHP